MPDSIIQVKNLGKKYIIKHQVQDRYLTLRDVFANKVKSLRRFVFTDPDNHQASPTLEAFWALKDVSFDVRSGEVIGIIGRNGAGKTTLLKILSRITEPTTGRIRIRRRVASLLEVGTGFHPELTGRENIFLNGAILGMHKNEIKQKFDEIVAFAEIEKFLDTPVKRYSSGMYVRLAFSVAAHLEPEILIVDEVLAVGDIGFQKKCLGKMENVANIGRTVLFVSHNMPAIHNLCSRLIVLNEGNMIFDGSVAEGIEIYNDLMLENSQQPLAERLDRQGSGDVKIESFDILNRKGSAVQRLITGEDYIFRFGFRSKIKKVDRIDFAFGVRDSMNRLIFRNSTAESGIDTPDNFSSTGFFHCAVPRFPLTKGKYFIRFHLSINGVESDYITGGYAALFEVTEGDYFKTGKINTLAPIVIPHKWFVVNRR